MPAATAKSTMTHRALPWLLLVAACGLTHHHLHLLLGAEAQQLQPAELPPATGAMRFLEGSWQGVVRDSGTKIRCAESVVQRDGILNQVYYDTEECSGDVYGTWSARISACPQCHFLAACSGYNYTNETSPGVTVITDESECALVRRNGDALLWWDGIDSTIPDSDSDNCPRVSAARTSVLDYEVLESHTRMDGGVPASQCCSWDYKGNVLNRGGGPPLVGSTTTFPPPSRRPPPPPSTTARICTSRGLVECGDRCMPQDGVCCNAEGYYCEAGWTCSNGNTCVKSRSRLSAGAKAGIIVGAVVGGLAFVAVLVVCIRWCRNRSANRAAAQYGHKDQEMLQQQQQQQPQQQLPYGVAAYPVLQPQHMAPAGYPAVPPPPPAPQFPPYQQPQPQQ